MTSTKLKPSRVQVWNVPSQWESLTYSSDTQFTYERWSGDMYYSDFAPTNVPTWSSLTISNISTEFTPTENFTVAAGTGLKAGIEYVLRVNSWSTVYTMTLWTGINNPNGYDTTLAANAVKQFKFLATSSSQLELEWIKDIQWGDIGWTLANQTDLQNALDSKQATLTAGDNVSITSNVISATDTTYTAWSWINIDANNEISNTLPWPTVSSTAPSSPSEWDLWYDTTNDILKFYDGSQWSATWKTYTAGSHINISNANVISTTWLQEELTAWENITIWDTTTTESDMKWPCPSGFHVPLQSEWWSLKWILVSTFGLQSKDITVKTYLKIPLTGTLQPSNGSKAGVNSTAAYWSVTASSWSQYVYSLGIDPFGVSENNTSVRATWAPVRPFKNTPVVPDSSWTTLYDWSSVATWAWVFHNATLWLISASWDWTTWITIADKNLGATTVYNSWDTLSEANCGWYFQWGNNYMFPYSWQITIENTQVNASTYWPWNYYSSSIFRATNGDWSSVRTNNLRWWTSQWTWQDTIHNVISATDTTYNAGTGINISSGTISADTTVLATQSDVNTKTFYLSSTSDTTNAQAAYDWFLAGKQPIIVLSDAVYTDIKESTSEHFRMYRSNITNTVSGVGWYTLINKNYISFSINSWTVASVWTGLETVASVLDPTTDYTTPYTPRYNGSPASKKYVDDHTAVVSSTAPSTPSQWSMWYDTTNNVLKIYDGSSWNAVWWLPTGGTEWQVLMIVSWTPTWVTPADSGFIMLDANSPMTIKYLRVWPQNTYQWLQSYSNDTRYDTI